MDIFELIKKDHRQVESLFAEIESSKDAKKIAALFERLYKELNLHSEVEELTFYPSMREYEETEELLEEAEEEHVEVKTMLEEMKPFSPTSSEFKTRLASLKSAVQHHVQEEENEVFPQVQQCMSKEELSALATEFQQTKSKLQKDMSMIPH
ncbi:MAG: hemerythrin domain-containing protein [Actinomycetota bacterium]